MERDIQMKLVLQRVKEACVTVEGEIIGEIKNGFLILVGISEEDTREDVDVLVSKMINLRVFEDESNKMNLSLKDIGGSVLSVSQFTLYGDVRKGRRPNFTKAARPKKAEELYDYFNEQIIAQNIETKTGQFGAMMDVQLINDGPVTIILQSEDGKII